MVKQSRQLHLSRYIKNAEDGYSVREFQPLSMASGLDNSRFLSLWCNIVNKDRPSSRRTKKRMQQRTPLVKRAATEML